MQQTDHTCVVVIPVHSPNPSCYELISFQQCFTVLGGHPIKVVAPQGIALDAYKKVVPHFETIFISPKWQMNVKNYNKLKISRFFYHQFRQYQYLLTYELDAFVFRDELESWCKKGYDYIGAPWFDGYAEAQNEARIKGVGNSGFSLRKVGSIEKILKKYYYQMSWEFNSGKENYIKACLKTPFRWLMNQTAENYTLQKYCDENEDIFFATRVPALFPSFRVAPVSEALKFSFEVRPDYLYELNDNKLPMGCHAWWRYDLAFWKPFIEQYGYKL